jgi:hypothetical protein
MNIFIILLPIFFLLYIVFIRHLQYFRSEFRIFFLHLIVVILINLIASLLLIYSSDFSIADFVITFSVYGIYCITFLEVWSLSQGGYSLSILHVINLANENKQDPNFSTLKKIGQEKQKSRIDYLINSGYLEVVDGCQLRLTSKGLFWGKVLKKIKSWVS